MINRYDIEDISKLWTDSSKFNYYMRVEIAHLRTHSLLLPECEDELKSLIFALWKKQTMFLKEQQINFKKLKSILNGLMRLKKSLTMM